MSNACCDGLAVRKRCNKCQNEYGRNYYRTHHEAKRLWWKDYYSRNKTSINERDRRYKESHKDMTIEISKKHEEKRRYNPKRLFQRCRAMAKYRDYPFTLTFDQFCEFENKQCFYCDSNVRGIAVDRMNNSMGYVLGNVVSCCYPCNRAKMAMSVSDFIDLCTRVSNKHSQRRTINV